MKYELILFDADGTLFDYDKAEDYALEKAIRSYELTHPREEYLPKYREVNHAIWQEFERAQITVVELKVERFRRFFTKMGLELDAVDFSERYLAYLGEGAFLIEGAVEILDHLKQHHRLALITNGISKVQHSRLGRTPILPYFDGIIISEEVGVSKPHVGIFEHTLETLQHADKKSVLIVGDSLSSDIQGGINFGIDTCWYNPEKKPNTSNLTPTYEIHNLQELKKLFQD